MGPIDEKRDLTHGEWPEVMAGKRDQRSPEGGAARPRPHGAPESHRLLPQVQGSVYADWKRGDSIIIVAGVVRRGS